MSASRRSLLRRLARQYREEGGVVWPSRLPAAAGREYAYSYPLPPGFFSFLLSDFSRSFYGCSFGGVRVFDFVRLDARTGRGFCGECSGVRPPLKGRTEHHPCLGRRTITEKQMQKQLVRAAVEGLTPTWCGEDIAFFRSSILVDFRGLLELTSI